MQNGFYHIILISFKPETSEAIREEVYNRYQTLGEECGGADAGILFWSVQKNLDQRKNIHLVEFAVFKDQEALDNLKKHPKHAELVKDFLIQYADWQIGDFIL
jgi:hypothetical protein